MIKPGSRYENGYVVPMDDGTVAVFRKFPVNIHLQDVGSIVWSDSMRIDRVGSRFTGAAKNWWKVMDSNPERENPWDIHPGDHVRVPLAQSKKNS